MRIIGIAGRIGSGKDIIADYLVKHHGFEILRFSGLLKDEVIARLPRTLLQIAHANGIFCKQTETPAEFLHRLVYEIKPPGVRELLQEYGTEVRRQDDPAYWVKEWLRKVEKLTMLDPKMPLVCPDTRFPNEARAIKNTGGLVIRVNRPSQGPMAPDAHESETALLDYPYDAVFTNPDIPLWKENLERNVAEWVLKWFHVR
jgi:hypothetical protein